MRYLEKYALLLFIKSSIILYTAIYLTRNLRKAAKMKRDKAVQHIRGKDCVAIGVKYHRTCSKHYTRIAAMSMNKKCKGCVVLGILCMYIHSNAAELHSAAYV